MNKTDLVTAVAEKAEISKKDAEKALTAVIDTVVEAVSKKDKVQLTGFGTFECRHRNARQGRDPRTNNTIEIPACDAPAFKPGKSFKDAVSGK